MDQECRDMHLKQPGRGRLEWLQSGAGLIEALVALAILAFGVLGMASMQTRILLESRSTNARAVAVRLASDLSERMQSNPGHRLPEYRGPSSPYLMKWGASPPPTDCWTVGCHPVELASFDLMQWKSSLSHLIPGGDARVFSSDSDPNQFGVLIGWPLTPVGATLKPNGSVSHPPPPLWVAPGVGDVNCQTEFVCHLVFIRP